MAPVARLAQVSFVFPGAHEAALLHETWDIHPESLSLVVGRSGSGKSSLLRCLNGLIPHFTGGKFGGSVTIGGTDTRTVPPRALGHQVGFVFQDPEVQLLTDRVQSDVAFGLEQAGMDRGTMRRRVDWAMEAAGISRLADRRPAHLSGGERQRVAIASAIATRPALLVLDEPTSQLDPAGARQIVESIGDLVSNAGLAIVIAEHRLEHLLGAATSLKVMGRDAAFGAPRDLVRAIDDPTPLPAIVRLARALGISPIPLTLEDARQAFARLELHPTSKPIERSSGEVLARLVGVDVELAGRRVLRDAALDVREGEIVALVGHNGSGKTTLLRAIAGLQPVLAGEVRTLGHDMRRTPAVDLAGRVGYVPQQATALFAAERLIDEFGTARERERPQLDAMEALRRFDLDGKEDRHPLDLSGGERERAALAVVMSRSPALLLLDEPTRGMDAWRKRDLARLLEDIRRTGTGIILATHDADLVAACATRVVALEGGNIVADGTPAETLPVAGMATQISQVFGAPFLTVDDVLTARVPGSGAGRIVTGVE